MAFSKKEKARAAPYIGKLMPDGTIFVGLSPTTKQPVYATPRDAPKRLTFNAATAYADRLDEAGYDDWRLPSRKELRLLYQNKDQDALKTAFQFASNPPEDWYWAIDGDNQNYGSALRFRDGKCGNTDHSKSAPTSIHCIRDGPWPDEVFEQIQNKKGLVETVETLTKKGAAHDIQPAPKPKFKPKTQPSQI